MPIDHFRTIRYKGKQTMKGASVLANKINQNIGNHYIQGRCIWHAILLSCLVALLLWSLMFFFSYSLTFSLLHFIKHCLLCSYECFLCFWGAWKKLEISLLPNSHYRTWLPLANRPTVFMDSPWPCPCASDDMTE